MVNMAGMGGRRTGEKPSSFSVTCSLLSQYLKEKGSLGEIGLGMTAAAARPPVDGRGKPETLRTMNLLPGVEAPEGKAANQDGVSELKKSPARSMELFPQRAGFAPSHSDKKPDLNREPGAVAAQMTIFYGGKMVVFDNFPADKARELMVMAGGGCPDPAQVFRVEKPGTTPVVLPQRPSCPPPAQHVPAAATILASTSESKAVAPVPASVPAVVAQEAQQETTQPASSDLPIARRVSLHRFLEKRKDRINSKAPYQLNVPAGDSPSSSASPAKLEDARQWLGLGPQTSKPEDRRR